MPDQTWDEKDEKELSKHEEKSREEKWRRDPLGSVIWAIILIWAGVVLLASNLGYLDKLELPFSRLPWDVPFIESTGWTLFFLGAGVIVLGEVVVRLLVPTYRQNVMGAIIGAMVLFALGLGNWTLIWPLILIAIGASMLLRGYWGKR